MNRTSALLIATLLLISGFSISAFACGSGCACCPAASTATMQPVEIRIDANDLPREAAHLAVWSVKTTAKLTARLPGKIMQQMQSGTEKAHVAFQAATGQTQSTFQRISTEVTSLSLQVLRSAFSYLLALLSGLLR